MRYHILATDYDGTLALHGKVDEPTIEALKSLKASLRKLILVTGRELEELIALFPAYDLFDLIVAENGALIYDPTNKQEFLLGERPPAVFIEELKQKKVLPLSVGKVIVATWEPHQTTVLEAIKNAGIEYQVIFNKGAVMVLPPGINKAKGLLAALKQLKISMHNVVAVGDAENDQAMLKAAECSVAVANALDSVKKEATIVTNADHGTGVTELIQMLLDNDLADADERLTNYNLKLGFKNGKEDFSIKPYRSGLLLAGTSGGGKSTLTSAFLESLIETRHQFCIVDPEGDYMDFPGVIITGDSEHEPIIDEVLTILENPSQNVVVCLLGVPLDKRPSFFNQLITKLTELRNKTGHPHWLILDEANHLMPSETESSFFNIPDHINNFLLIATTPKRINNGIMKYVETIMVVGNEPDMILEEFADIKQVPYTFNVHPLPRGNVWVWNGENEQPFIITAREPAHLTRRHIKKYATGTMEYNNFFFRGPENKLNLKAYNVVVFTQLAEGVDDETWLFHLRNHDYSKWFEVALHDHELAALTREIEENESDARISKNKILTLIKERYTLK